MAQPHIFVNCINCQCMSSAFKELSPNQLATVDERRSELEYKKGETICKEGSFISNLIFVKSGLVKVFLDRGDEPSIISIEKSGTFLGLPSLYGEGVFHYTAVALENTKVCLTDVKLFKELVEGNSKFASEVVKLVNVDLIKSYDRLYSCTNKQVTSRFAELLIYCKDHVYESNPFDLKLSRRDMADVISTTSENISRLIKQFKNNGTIEMNEGGCQILDIELLTQISNAR